MSTKFLVISIFAAAAGITVYGVGCQRPIGAMCKQQCACGKCTDFDLEQCEDKVEKAAQKASDKSCGSEFQTYVDCLDDNLSCQNGGAARTDKCKNEEKVLLACTHEGNPFKTVCEDAQDKVNECTGQMSSSSGGQQQVDCTGTLQCQSQCIADASCEELLGQVNSQNFNNCISDCGFQEGSSGGFD